MKKVHSELGFYRDTLVHLLTDVYVKLNSEFYSLGIADSELVYGKPCIDAQSEMIAALVTKGKVDFLTKVLPTFGKQLDSMLTLDRGAIPSFIEFDSKVIQPLRLLAERSNIPLVTGCWPGREAGFKIVLPRLFAELWLHVLLCLGDHLIDHADGVEYGMQSRKTSAELALFVAGLRQLCFVFYKLEMPYPADVRQTVIDSFIKTEEEVAATSQHLSLIARAINNNPYGYNSIVTTWETQNERQAERQTGIVRRYLATPCTYSRKGIQAWGPIPCDDRWAATVIRRARYLLHELFRGFDPRDIRPKHGPGAVSTKEETASKYRFKRINPRIEEFWPFLEYFVSGACQTCDAYKSIDEYAEVEALAKVILVPKDSRGPRLISEEPLEFQWIQQGLKGAVVELVERHPLTRDNVRFTDQQPNRNAALLGSRDGAYATLDLKDASDRISVGLVELLFPAHVACAWMAARSLATVLPGGRVLRLEKYAPMGSALCFPTMALSIWALLTAVATDEDARKSIYVYGDDIIVKNSNVRTSIITLEAFGLRVNSHKSCTSGLFRESCGMDAYGGICVTPLRIKKRWGQHLAPDTWASYIACANNFQARGYEKTAQHLGSLIQESKYPVPCDDVLDTEFKLVSILGCVSPKLRSRWNSSLQRREYRVPIVRSRRIVKSNPGYAKLLRFFTERGRQNRGDDPLSIHSGDMEGSLAAAISAQFPRTGFNSEQYTLRGSKSSGDESLTIEYRWRGLRSD